MLLIDTRTAEEYTAGHVEGALLMPYDTIGDTIEGEVPDKTVPVFLYCRSGIKR